MATFAELRETVSSLVKESFVEFKPNWLKLLGGIGLMFLAAAPIVGVELAAVSLLGALGGAEWLKYLLIPVLGALHFVLVLGLLAMQLGLARICLKMARHESISLISDLKSGVKSLVPLLLSSLIMVPIVVLGFVCLIIPGIYLAIRFSFYSMALVDGYSPVEALKRSFQISNGHVLEVIALFVAYQIASFLLCFLPVINILIIVFFAQPFVMFLWARFYNRLDSETGSHGQLELKPASVGA